MSARLLVLTAGFGEGHNAAARALATAADRLHGAGTAQVVDAFALAAPRLNNLLRKGYLGVINRAPNIWCSFYNWLDRSPVAPALMRNLRMEKRALAAVIARERPEVLCSTYPAYAFMMEEFAREGIFTGKHFNVVTDSISINSLWWRAGSAGWFLPNEDSARVMRDAGVPADKLHVLGFPVNPIFAASASELTPPELAHGATLRVLYIINSRRPAAAEMARALLRETHWEVTCTVGRNEPLRTELMRLATNRRQPARILGWTDEIPKLLMTHHVVISKAGGATTQEALAAHCPMVVNQIVPGQEQGNYDLLRRYGVGALAETPAELLFELNRAFSEGGYQWRRWRRALEPISYPEAAQNIARHLLPVAASATEAEPVPLPLRPAVVSAA